MALKNVIILSALALVLENATATRNLGVMPGYNIAAMLQNSGELANCWNTLKDLKSCSNEIVSFFINRRGGLDPCCCRVIATISHTCWPAILSSFGFTPKHGVILQSHCHAASGSTASSASSLILHNSIQLLDDEL